MNVYYRKNGNTWKEDRRKSPLSCIPVNRTFLWGSHEIRIPALYIGRGVSSISAPDCPQKKSSGSRENGPVRNGSA